MTREEDLAYLNHLNVTLIHLGLDPVLRLLERLNHPERSFPAILIGGTNGKGSIAAMTASMLAAGGFSVGLYTSPHLTDVRERVRVNGAIISPDAFAERIREVREALGEEDRVTYFEFLTAAAFLHFHREAVDVAVLEVGLGGRLDATNVVVPTVSIISNISLEHRDYLGDTLVEIAREKGGIIKDAGLCLTACKQKAVINVLEDICRTRNAALLRLGRDIRVRADRAGRFSYYGLDRTLRNLSCPLLGRHQIENAALAIGAVELLGRWKFPISEEALRQGMKAARWEGRMEILSHRPTILVDGAHNPAGAAVLCRAITTEFSYRRLILIFGVLQDKDYRAMLVRLLPLAATFVLTKPATPRAVPPACILPVTTSFRGEIIITETVEEAVQRAVAAAKPEDMICATGSLYVVGQVKQALAARES
jgi:dihydrofolate synthase / folylpolyglutamate synthase